jgi:hypothetical protein
MLHEGVAPSSRCHEHAPKVRGSLPQWLKDVVASGVQGNMGDGEDTAAGSGEAGGAADGVGSMDVEAEERAQAEDEDDDEPAGCDVLAEILGGAFPPALRRTRAPARPRARARPVRGYR